MLQALFTKLKPDDAQALLAHLKKDDDSDSLPDLSDAEIHVCDIDFYREARFAEIRKPAPGQETRLYCLYDKSRTVVLDGYLQTLMHANKQFKLRINDDNVNNYIRLYFIAVRVPKPTHLVEQPEDIRWREDPAPATRRGYTRLLRPLTARFQPHKKAYAAEITVIIDGALARFSLSLDLEGHVILRDPEILADHMPVFDTLLER